MKKLKMQTPDLTDKNIERIASLFPHVITEVEDLATKDTKNHEKKYKKVVDFDLLRQMLSDNLVEADDERYRLDWPGKKASLLKANTPITKTLRPCREESVNFDTTQNLYIEGDNFEVLKILQESYLGKVKMIYIDPPYNTGNDFIYKDNFAKSKEEYEAELGVEDEGGGKLFRNTDSNGRFHSDWLSMMYERLLVARDLLKDDGVIFINIDDNEVHNLRKICDEVFGESNLVTTLVWEKKKKGTFLSNTITNVKEYVHVYAKSINNFNGLIGEINRSSETYPCINASNKRELRTIPSGLISKYREKDFSMKAGERISDTTMDLILHSDLVITNGVLGAELKIEGNWRYTQENMVDFAEKGELYITQDLYLRRIVNEPRYKTLKDLLTRTGDDESSSHKEINIDDLFADGWGSNEDADEELRILMEAQKLMDFPKPRKLIEKLIVSLRDKESIILDFFAGSATTAHAVLDLNKQDRGNRKFIMVQLPEKTDENSEAYKAGYKTIAEIGKERIRRAGKKIVEELATKNTKKHEKEEGKSQKSLFSEAKDENFRDLSCLSWQKNLDIGFRVYKVDSTNMKEVLYHPAELVQKQLPFLESNIKEDRTPEDLLTQVILDLGLELSLPVETKKILNNTVFIVQANALVACFDDDIDFKTCTERSRSIVDEIADLKPFKVVFKDASFKDDKDRINVEERFKRLSPETKVTVI